MKKTIIITTIALLLMHGSSLILNKKVKTHNKPAVKTHILSATRT